MPNTKSAKKALRSSLKKRGFNLVSKNKIRNSLKDLRKGISEGLTQSQEALSKAFSALDKAVKTNFIPKGRADRKKSRLAKLIATSFPSSEATMPKAEKKVAVTKEVTNEAKPKTVSKTKKVAEKAE